MVKPATRTQSEIDRKRRRRRRRFQIIVIYTLIAVGLAWFFESQATTTVIFVRHAEKAALPADDPALSEAGQRRAAELARQLVDADVVPGVGVDVVYSTSYRRTVETAKPVADALGLQVMMYDAADTESFLETVVRQYKGKII
ncbi:MAG: histidine phosphatase family protein, partial [Woeseiaceae bacterium]